LQILERSTAQNAAIVVFPSQERASFFQQVSRLKQSPVIVPNLPRKSFFKISNKLNWQELICERFNKKQILLQGSISIQNSMIDLIKSLSASDIVFCIKFMGIIGKKEYNLMKKNAEKENVLNRIYYCNFVPYPEIKSHTWMASLGVCLYKNINLNNQTMATASNKIYEYAACGLPVIVSDFPNYRKYLDNESWVRFADPDNPHSIAAAVQDILSDFENYRKMCLAARQAFEEKFNYETVFAPLLLKIKELVDSSERRKLSNNR
jgi:glycosyltransferase involved in cell wall biosynthesis